MLNTKLWIRIIKMDYKWISFAEVICNSLCLVIFVLLILLSWLLPLSIFFLFLFLLLFFFFLLLLFSVFWVHFKFLFTLVTIDYAFKLFERHNLSGFVFFLFLLNFLSNLGSDCFSDLFCQRSFSSFIWLFCGFFLFDVILFFFCSKRFA